MVWSTNDFIPFFRCQAWDDSYKEPGWFLNENNNWTIFCFLKLSLEVVCFFEHSVKKYLGFLNS